MASDFEFDLLGFAVALYACGCVFKTHISEYSLFFSSEEEKRERGGERGAATYKKHPSSGKSR